MKSTIGPTIGLIFAILGFAATPAFAEAPCKASNKTAATLDQILVPGTLADITADKAIKQAAFANIVSIMQTDECVQFLLGKSKTKNLAAILIEQKQASPATKSARVINTFLSKQ